MQEATAEPGDAETGDWRMSEDKAVVRCAALAIARVIARKTIAEHAQYAGLDGLSKILATEDLAQGVVGGIVEEAQAATHALETHLASMCGHGAIVLSADELTAHAQSAFESALPEDASPYEVSMAWRAVGRRLFSLLAELAEDRAEAVAGDGRT